MPKPQVTSSLGHCCGVHRRDNWGLAGAGLRGQGVYRLDVAFSDAFSDEKRRTMEAFGAHITDVVSDQRKIAESLIKAMVRKAAEISASPGHWYRDQLNDTDATNGYRPLGEEIWAQTAGRVDAFVLAVGTAHAIHGAARALWAHRPEIRIVAVEPQESAVLSGRPSGAHQIEGIGIGFVPPRWEPGLVNGKQRVCRVSWPAEAAVVPTPGDP